MPIENAPWSIILAPALLTLGVILLAASSGKASHPLTRGLVVIVVYLAVLRYLSWRATQTLILHEGWLQAAWSGLCFLVEALALGDAAILFLTFARTSDRRADADRHEARLRTVEARSLPKVDVLIPTYNEPLQVLEKTIVGARSLDWPNLAVYVLDDGRRPWLRAYCEAKGVGYVTRPDNVGAKAGNINHALRLTDGEFVAVFDADFVPQRGFLMRTMGFFEDPKIGIVQVPHAFYNHDPMQTNLGLRKSLPDDQRFFFEAIMPSRDGWDAAFCCGSNSVTRRSALEAVGGGLPDGSITEDQLLSLVMLRKGFVTRYLNERLAYGLAPETVSAFFVQRQRWARGAFQLLVLPSGPLGPNLSFAHRLLFLPTHWLTQSIMCLMALIAPILFLWFGLPPMAHTSVEASCHYLLPMLIAIFGGLMMFAPGKYNPLAAQVLGTFQSFKLLPTVLATLVRPHGHAFKVTPKGAQAGAAYERPIYLACLLLIGLMLGGLALNLLPEWRRIEDVALVPLVALWCAFDLVVLFLVSLLCLQMPVRRQEERFELAEPVLVRRPGAPPVTLMSIDLSLSGVALSAPDDHGWTVGERLELFVSGVGWISARIARSTPGRIGCEFQISEPVQHDLLIRKLFTGGQNTAADAATPLQVTVGLLSRILTADMRAAPAESSAAPSAPEERSAPCSLMVPPSEPEEPLEEALARLERAA